MKKNKKKNIKKQNQKILTNEDKIFIREFEKNSALLRETIRSKIFDARRSIDYECGYLETVTQEAYIELYNREGIGTRVVKIFPEESWSMDPVISEDQETDLTEFEKAWEDLQNQFNIYFNLQRIDIISGIGKYGILLLGINDGKNLNEPIDNINEKGEKIGQGKHKLIYLKPFADSVVTVKTYMKDITNPRYGQPEMYQVEFQDYEEEATSARQSLAVHWSRVIHVADNREMSDTFGVPRMQCVYNRLYDVRKILGGSGEMFWQGGFPGLAFEFDPDIKFTETDKTNAKTQVAAYYNGLQRYLAIQGMSVKSLSNQISDPKTHFEIQIISIAISLGIPQRKLFGSEQAKLASTEDAKSWNKKIAGRQTKYVIPMIIRSFIDRLIVIGALPEPVEYFVKFPDLNIVSEDEKATVALKKTEALAKYIKGNVMEIIPPAEFLKMIMKMPFEEIEVILEAALDRIKEEETDEGEIEKEKELEEKEIEEEK